MISSEKNCNTCGQKCAIKYHGCSNWIPNGRKVAFVKVDAIMQKIDEELGRQRTNNRYNEGYTDGILYVWKVIDNILNEVREE